MTDMHPDPVPPATGSRPQEPPPNAPSEAAGSVPAGPARSTSPIGWVVALALAAMVGTLLFVGGYLAAGARGSGSCVAPAQSFDAFCQAYEKLKEQFVDQLDDETLAEGAIRGMFEYGVQDPFSGYMSPDDYRRALGDLSGEFSGIGAEMGVRNLEDPADLDACSSFSSKCVLVVVAPLEGTPAENAGLQAGDIVEEIDGDSVEGMTLEDAVNQVRGEAGTDVT